MMWWKRRRQSEAAVVSRNRRALVWAKTGGRCWYDGRQLSFDAFHVDHVVPRSAGGSNELSNLVPACPACNLRKANLPLEAFREREAQRHGRGSRRFGIFRRRYEFYFERAGLADA